MIPNLDLSAVTVRPPDAPSASRRQFLTPIPGHPGEFLLVLDNTSLSVIKRCHQAARNYLLLGREAHAKTAALTFGGAIHEGLELFHWNQFLEQKANDYGHVPYPYPEGWIKGQDCIVSAQDAAVTHFFQENPGPPDEYRTLSTALEVLKHYRHRSDPLLHPDYEWEILADPSGPIIERAFELPLDVLDFRDHDGHGTFFMGDYTGENRRRDDGTPETLVHKVHVAWSGRIDLITKSNGRNRITDHKTSSIDGESFIQSFQLSSQTIGYVWAAQQLYPDLDVSGFCLNCIRLKRPTGSAGLMERGPRGGDPALAFFRAYFDYSPERVLEWQRDTVLLIEDFLHSVSRNSFPLNDSACFNKFGKCQYHDVCTLDDPRVRDRLLASDSFKQVTWNPTNGR